MSFKIVIDSGHGNHTAGKRSPDGMREHWFNSAVCKYMLEELKKYEGVDVLIVHDPSGEQDVPLKERVDKANDWGADVYVSLHANANNGIMGSWGGIETYVYTTKPKEADALAHLVQNNLVKSTGLRDRGVKYADFYVIKYTKMTAILIEHGFMDSTTDLPKLKDEGFRKLCAAANVKALAEFYKLKRKPEPVKPASSPSTGLHRVIIDGNQVGAYGQEENVIEQVKKYLGRAKEIKIEKI